MTQSQGGEGWGEGLFACNLGFGICHLCLDCSVPAVVNDTITPNDQKKALQELKNYTIYTVSVVLRRN